MNEFAAIVIPALGTALLHFLWQGALLGLLAALAFGLLRNARPQARYAVACAALAMSLLLPASTLAWLLAVPSVEPASALAAMFVADPTASSTTGLQDMLASQATTSLPWIVMLWASGVATLLLRMAGGLLVILFGLWTLPGPHQAWLMGH